MVINLGSWKRSHQSNEDVAEALRRLAELFAEASEEKNVESKHKCEKCGNTANKMVVTDMVEMDIPEEIKLCTHCSNLLTMEVEEAKANIIREFLHK